MTDYLVMLPSNDNSKHNDARYFPLSDKIGMNKKTRQKFRHQTQYDDESFQADTKKNELVILAARALTSQEAE